MGKINQQRLRNYLIEWNISNRFAMSNEKKLKMRKMVENNQKREFISLDQGSKRNFFKLSNIPEREGLFFLLG